MISSIHAKQALRAAVPIILGYIGIGIPCGILCSSIGLSPLQALIMSCIFYSGAGQFMIPNMWLAGSPIASIILSVSFVNTRQMLYSASLAPKCTNVGKKLAFYFAATVTDESFGVNMAKFEEGDWSVGRATLVNVFSMTSWTISNVIGAFIGNAIGIPLAIAAFAMTSIFICLLVMQKFDTANVIAIVTAIIGVYVCKLVGLTGPAILLGALFGVICAFAYSSLAKKGEG